MNDSRFSRSNCPRFSRAIVSPSQISSFLTNVYSTLINVESGHRFVCLIREHDNVFIVRLRSRREQNDKIKCSAEILL